MADHDLDAAALDRYLAAHLPGYAGGLAIERFFGGQSNPTYRLGTRAGDYVLRRKPSGTLLPSAHQIDREYRIMSALQETDVPVPRMELYCRDTTVIGAEFFVMEFLPGRVFRDMRLPGLAPDERARVYDAMNAVMAALHNVDWQALRLADFGRPGNYCARQVSRWTKQYRASETQKIAAMEALIEWLPAQLPQDERVTIVHGDFRLENMLVHATLPKVLGLIDWELATLGDPLADLAHNAMLYHLPAESFGGFVGLDLAALGIPSEAEYVAAYCRRTGRDAIPQWRFYMTFALFRMAAILQGVYARGLQGNASSPDAQARGVKAALCAERGWALAQS